MSNKIYYNYHKHDCYGNFVTMDVVTRIEEYCIRAKELGHTHVFTTNHGFQGNVFEWINTAKEYDLKVVVGFEGYFVKDRFESDRSNKHIIIIALNDNGVRQINGLVSESFITGRHVKPRIDEKLLFEINPKDVVVTTACVGGIWNDLELIKKCKEYFKDNFYLEVQNHNQDYQKDVNRQLLEYSTKLDIKIIHANDSHYINVEDSRYRDIMLKAKGFHYETEDEFILDYPDYETIVERYKKQGILSDQQIFDAINNTCIFENVCANDFYNHEIKLPSISKNPKTDLRKIIVQAWDKEKHNIDKNLMAEYEKAIYEEVDIIEKTHMSDYFIIDHNVVKLAKEKYNGTITYTGRGSAPSFYVTKLLGLTDIDRVAAPITLFPSRFMSVERINEAKSLPDIDINSADSEPFIKATKELLGEDNCEWMIAWKPFQKASAFRLYCKGIGLNNYEYNDVAMALEDYESNPKWENIIKESSKYIGTVEGVSESPCSMLLYDKNVKREIGLIQTGDSKKGYKLCCNLDGINCDKYKYLKNDYLTVTCWAIIKDVCDMVDIDIPTIKELDKVLDAKTFDIYKNGLTCSINQADSLWATNLVKIYQPKSIEEMSAFVAIIRPGCKSLLNDFIHRRPYSTGIAKLDEILKDGKSRMIYQELIMKYLIWLGVKETQSYDIIKKIAKKVFTQEGLNNLEKQLREGWIRQVGEINGFDRTWKIVEDAARYSFNASHSLSYGYDSLYGAYLKSHYPLEYYTVALNTYEGDQERTPRLVDELSYFGIELKPISFGVSTSKYTSDKKNMFIYKGIGSIKYCNSKIAEELLELSKGKKYNEFVDLLEDIKGRTSVDNRQLNILTTLNFFNRFGNNKYLLDVIKVFNKFRNCKVISKCKLEELELSEYLIKKYSNKETKSQYRDIDNNGLIKEIASRLKNDSLPVIEQIKKEYEFLESSDYKNKDVDKKIYIVVSYDEKTICKPRIKLKNIYSGGIVSTRIKRAKVFSACPFGKWSILSIESFDEEDRVRKDLEGKWVSTGEKELILNNYCLIDIDK